ncbi:MAG: hypothetical protein AAF430_22110 [Myxococcota bacterium]
MTFRPSAWSARASMCATTFLVVCLAWASGVAAATLVTPPEFENEEAGYIGVRFRGESRTQHIFAASMFGAGEMEISGVRFRRSPFETIFFQNFDQVEIVLSTTSVAPDQQSSAFAANRGADAAVVRDGPLSIRSQSSDNRSPSPFEVEVPFANPFRYDPALGNLLLEWKVTGQDGVVVWLDADTDGDSRYNVGFASGPDADQAEFLLPFGLVTQFEFTPVPEPSTGLLVALGVSGMGMPNGIARRRCARRRSD